MNTAETALTEDNPHYGCDALNPICKPPISGSTAQCVCSGTDTKCTISESTRCDATGTVSDPMDGTCKCGANNECDKISSTPACLRESDGSEPTEGDKTGTSCQVYQFCVFNCRFFNQFIFNYVYLISSAVERQYLNLKI